MLFRSNSSSLRDIDLDNFSGLTQGLRNSFYLGVTNNVKTTSDGKSPIEVIISAPTKLVTTEEGESTLTTGDGIVPDFKEDGKDEKQLLTTFEEKRAADKGKPKGLKKMKKKVETDQDRKKLIKIKNIEKEKTSGKLIMENDSFGKPIDKVEFKGEVEMVEELEK